MTDFQITGAPDVSPQQAALHAYIASLVSAAHYARVAQAIPGLDDTMDQHLDYGLAELDRIIPDYDDARRIAAATALRAAEDAEEAAEAACVEAALATRQAMPLGLGELVGVAA